VSFAKRFGFNKIGIMEEKT